MTTGLPSHAFPRSIVSTPPLPLPQLDVVKIPDPYSSYSNFKHRLWLTWYIWYAAQKQYGAEKRLPWLAIVGGADADGDLWLWEDGDEESIQEFTQDLSLLAALPEMPISDWDDACHAFEARQSQPTVSVGLLEKFAQELSLDSLPELSQAIYNWDDTSSDLEARQSRTTASVGLLASLTPQNRFRFIAWLIIAGPVKRDLISRQVFRSLEIFKLILLWGTTVSVHPADSEVEICKICGISHFLPLWIETMLTFYLVDDLESIPWNLACDCLER